ncbi:unnamed protein product [Rotaria magnacalcarata]
MGIISCPGRTLRHVNGRIRLNYGSFRPGTGAHIRCTVLRLSYGIIRWNIRCPLTIILRWFWFCLLLCCIFSA